jgi:hypothetical protein
MIKNEIVKTQGGIDSFGNVGFVKTNRNVYVSNQYENLPWKREKDGVRGILHFLKQNKVIFVPYHFA